MKAERMLGQERQKHAAQPLNTKFNSTSKHRFFHIRPPTAALIYYAIDLETLSASSQFCCCCYNTIIIEIC